MLNIRIGFVDKLRKAIFVSKFHFLQWLTVAAMSLFGYLYMQFSSQNSLWLDECFSVNIASHSYLQIPSVLKSIDNHPPLYYWVLRLFMSVGRSEFVIRLPSVLATIATGVVVYFIGKKVRDSEYGFMSAILYMSAHWAVLMSVEARDFSLAVLFMVLALWFVLQIIERGEWKDWFLFQVVGVCSILTFYYSALFYIALHVVIMVSIDRKDGTAIRRWVVSSIFAAIPVFLWLPSVQQQLLHVVPSQQERTAYPVQQMINSSLIMEMMDQFLNHSPMLPLYKLFAGHISWQFHHIRWVFPVALFVAGFLGSRGPKKVVILKDTARIYWPYLVAFLAIGPVVMAFALFVAGWFFINVRYVLVLSILMAFMTVEGVRWICDAAIKRWAVFSVLLIAQIGLLVTSTFQIKREGWREAVAFVEKTTDAADSVVIMANYTAQCYTFYAKTNRRIFAIPSAFPGWGSIGPNVIIENLIPGTEGQRISSSFLPQLINRFGREKKVILLLSHVNVSGNDLGSSIVMDSIREAGLGEIEKLDFNGVKIHVYSRA